MSSGTEELIEIADINVAPAAAVRAVMNSECVDRYMELVEDGVRLPPVDVYAFRDQDGGLTAFLGDGRHRLEAWTAAGQREALCTVTWCGSVEDAERRAWEHAAGANAGHGLPRSVADKLAAVTAIIGRAEYENASDNKLAELCKVSVHFARKVRKELSAEGKLSGGASAAARNYKDNGTTGAVAPPAVTVPEPIPAPVELVAQPEPAEVEGGEERGEPGAGAAEVDRATSAVLVPVGAGEPPAKPKPADHVRDGAGRVVPDHMADLFRCGRVLAKKFREGLQEDYQEVERAAHVPGGEALPAVLNTVEAEIRSAAENVSSSVPAYLCPYVNEAGTHTQPGACRVCIGRGWLTRHVFRQLPDAVKQMCRSKVGKDATQDVGGGAA